MNPFREDHAPSQRETPGECRGSTILPLQIKNQTERNFNLHSLCMGITLGLTMKTVTVKIPEALETKLRKKAKAANQSVSEIVRHALAREMEADAVDFSKLAAPYLGMFSGPADLSTREGYGSRESR